MKSIHLSPILLFIGLFLTTFSSAQKPGAQVGYDFLKAMDANDKAALRATLSPDFQIYHPNFPGPLNFDQFYEMQVIPFNKAFEKMNHAVSSVCMDGNQLAMRGAVSGKHVGELMGIPASGASINVPWLSFALLNENGKIKELHVQFNQLAFLGQLGVNPMAKN